MMTKGSDFNKLNCSSLYYIMNIRYQVVSERGGEGRVAYNRLLRFQEMHVFECKQEFAQTSALESNARLSNLSYSGPTFSIVSLLCVSILLIY